MWVFVVLPFVLFCLKNFKSKVNTRMVIVLTSPLKAIARFP